MSKLKCLLCDDIVESRHRHDWNQCKCGACFIDGGNDYLRVGGDPDNFKILEYPKESQEKQCGKKQS